MSEPERGAREGLPPAPDKWTGRRAFVLTLLLTGGLLITLLGLLLPGVSSGGFVVSSGHVTTKHMWQRVRRCVGITYEPDWRDGWTTYCIGIPRGPWRCYEQPREDSEELVEVPCR